MAKFYNVDLIWSDRHKGKARAVGNNAAWLCSCGEVLLGPTLWDIEPCPNCGKEFRVLPVAGVGTKVDQVHEL